MLMWFYLGVEFPQDSSFLNYIRLPTNLPTAHFFPIFISSSPHHVSLSLSPLTVRLLRCSGPSVPHIIISENSHTARMLQHRWVAWSLSDRWIGKYLPSQIVFLPRSSFHPYTHRLPPCHTHLFVPCCRFLFFFCLLSQWSRLHLITGASHRHLLCKHACIHIRIFWIYDEKDGCVCMEAYTHIYGREGLSKQRVDNNCPVDNGVFYEA